MNAWIVEVVGVADEVVGWVSEHGAGVVVTDKAKATRYHDADRALRHGRSATTKQVRLAEGEA